MGLFRGARHTLTTAFNVSARRHDAPVVPFLRLDRPLLRGI